VKLTHGDFVALDRVALGLDTESRDEKPPPLAQILALWRYRRVCLMGAVRVEKNIFAGAWRRAAADRGANQAVAEIPHRRPAARAIAVLQRFIDLLPRVRQAETVKPAPLARLRLNITRRRDASGV
jgi:hypothetical protein